MTTHRLLVVPPGCDNNNTPPDAVTVAAVKDMRDFCASARPEHRAIRDDMPDISRRARMVARDLSAAVHPDIRGPEFWEVFHPTFAVFSIAPALATYRALTRVLESVDVNRALVRENPRTPSWWAGAEHFEPVVRDVFRSAGIPCSTVPGRTLRWLRSALLPLGARYWGRREFESDLSRMNLDTPRPDIAECDILFVGAGASVADIIADLWQRLTEDLRLRCHILDTHHDNFTAAANARDLDVVDIGAFMPSSNHSPAGDWREWWEHYRDRRQQVDAYAALPTGVQTAVDERMRMSLIRHVGHWRTMSRASRAALETFRPRVLVTFHPYLMANTGLTVWAREMGISWVFLQHGALGHWRHSWPVLRPDTMLVWGEFARDLYDSVFDGDVSIQVTGNSRYDDLAAEGAEISEDARQLSQGYRSMVCLATQPNEHQYYDGYESWWIGHIARACEKLDAALVIKLHPADENLRLYEKARNAHPETVRIIKHGEMGLSDILKASDLMVTRNSTVVIEATVLGTPALTVEYTDAAEQFPFAETGAVVRVTDPGVIDETLKTLLYDEQFRSRLAERAEDLIRLNAGPINGQATHRICNHLAREVECSQSHGES